MSILSNVTLSFCLSPFIRKELASELNISCWKNSDIYFMNVLKASDDGGRKPFLLLFLHFPLSKLFGLKEHFFCIFGKILFFPYNRLFLYIADISLVILWIDLYRNTFDRKSNTITIFHLKM